MAETAVDTLAPPVLIDDQDSLDHLALELARQPRLAVDTESNSLHAYRERVCLIQFSTAEVDYLVDPLALDNLTPLGPIFSNPKIEKIFHAAEYDLLCLRRDHDFAFTNLFDTMQAARILGYRQVGLDRLLAEGLGVQINKRFQKADWGIRPLSAGLIDYARLDTHYLLPLRDLLKAALEAKGRWPLAEEDFRRACEDAAQKSKPAAAARRRFSGRRDLSPRQLTILNELSTCRERIAAQLDRPLFKVMDDDTMISVARAAPRTAADLAAAGLSEKQIQRWGGPILDSVARGLGAPLIRRLSVERPDGAFLNRLDALKAWRKKVAKEMGVESDVVLPKPILYTLAERGPRKSQELAELMSQSPWRLKHFGPQILDVIRG